MENQELNALLGNLKSIVDQISQLSAGSETEEVEPIQEMGDEEMVNKILKFLKQEEPMEEPMEEEPEEEIEKDMATGSDDADDRIEDQPEVNIENVDEVAKAIAKALKSKVRKSQKVVPLRKEIEVIKKQNSELRKALEGIFEGLGIAEEIKKSQEVIKKEKAIPVNDPNEIQKTLDFISKSLEKNNQIQRPVNANSNELRKSLVENDGQLLKGLFTKNQK